MASSRRVAADLQLLIASLVTGVAGASFVLVSGRAVGLEAFAPMAQLWTIWSISAATLLFAYQQWAIRLDIGRSVRLGPALRGSPAGLLAAAALGTAGAALAVRHSLFHSPSLFWPAAAGLVVVGTVLSGIVRGVLATVGRHGLLAVIIAADNVIRVAIAVVLVVVGATVEWYAAALLASFAILVIGLKPGFTTADLPLTTDPSTTDPVLAGPGSRARSGTATLGSAAIAGFLSHAALAGPPLLVAVNGGSAETISSLFIVLTAIRIPHLVLQAGAPRAGVIFQGWVDAGHTDRLRRARLIILAAAVIGAGAALGAGAVLGDLLVGTLFDIRGRIDALTYGLMAAAGVLSVGGAFATVLLVARGRNRFLVSRWAALLGVAVVAGLVAGVTGLQPTAIGLVVLHLAVLGALSLPSGGDGPTTTRTRPTATGPGGRAPIRRRRATT